MVEAACGRHDPIELARCRVTPAVAGAARGRPPNRARHPRLSAEPSSPQRASPGRDRGGAVPATPPVKATCAERRSRRTHHPPNRQRSSSTPTSGTPAHTPSGGTSNTLLAGLAARLAQQMGRVTADGSVDLTMPVNERTAGDTRANAITNVDFTVDPAPAPTDLREIRAAIKQALIRSQEVPDERWELLHLAPLLPQWLVRRMRRRFHQQCDQRRLVQPR